MRQKAGGVTGDMYLFSGNSPAANRHGADARSQAQVGIAIADGAMGIAFLL